MATAPQSERSLGASMAAEMSWANTGRAAFEQKFLDAAGGDAVRAAHLRAAHFERLALLSAQSRRKARELTVVATSAEAELATMGGEPDAGAA